MAEEKKPRTRRSVSAKSNTAKNETISHQAVADAEVKPATNDVPKRKVRQTLPLDTMVCCASSVASGKLLYQSKRLQGCSFEWNGFGDEQYIELAELQSMRNAYPAFFEQNWILIDDKEVLSFLHADRFYKYIYSIEDFNRVFTYSPGQIEHIVPELSNGLKRSIASIARQKYESGELDSMACIKALERTTGFTILD